MTYFITSIGNVATTVSISIIEQNFIRHHISDRRIKSNQVGTICSSSPFKSRRISSRSARTDFKAPNKNCTFDCHPSDVIFSNNDKIENPFNIDDRTEIRTHDELHFIRNGY